MEELLKKLLEAEILSPETKKELEQAFDAQIQAAMASAKTETETKVRAELTEQWIKERDALIEAVDTKVTEYLHNEVEELKEDIEKFRDLEAEYAGKLVESKAEMAEELKGDLATLVEQLDAFLEIRLAAELEELAADIEEAKKLDFGRKIYEAVAKEYRDRFVDEDGIEKELQDLRAEHQRVTESLKVVTESRAELERKIKLDEVLAPLAGRQREVMETILRSVATDDLETGYKTFIGRVVKDSTENTTEKEGKVLAEGDSKEVKKVEETVAVTGDVVSEAQEDETPAEKRLTESEKRKLQRLAGIIS